MLHIRGQTTLNTVRFVKERYGAAAHARVLDALPLEVASSFGGHIRDASWKRLDDTLAYMEAAKRLLAADDPDFHKEMGRFSGQVTGSGTFRLFIGGHPEVAVSRAAFMWRFLYDAGRVELVASGPGHVVIRLHDFRPAQRAWCERVTGFMESLMDLAGAPEPVCVEAACVHEGAAYCEMRGTWSVRS